MSNRSMMRGVLKVAVSGVIIAAAALPAAAHHPLGGTTPTTFWHGLLSGFGHPVIGLDHLAFIIAAGIASAFTGLRYLAPLMFIGASLAGCLMVFSLGQPAQLEMLVAASVALIGVMVLSGRPMATPIYLALFAIAGIFHGGAYAGAMIGAEPTPIAAYLTGLAFIQYAIAATMTWVTVQVWRARSAKAIEPRLAGAVIAGVGVTFLLELVEKLALGT